VFECLSLVNGSGAGKTKVFLGWHKSDQQRGMRIKGSGRQAPIHVKEQGPEYERGRKDFSNRKD